MVVTLFLVEERTSSLLVLVVFSLTGDRLTPVCRSCLEQPRSQRFDKLDMLDYLFRSDQAVSLYLCCSQTPPAFLLAAQTCQTLRCHYWLGDNTDIIFDIPEREREDASHQHGDLDILGSV